MKKSTAFFLAANSLAIGFALGVLLAPEAKPMLQKTIPIPQNNGFEVGLKPIRKIRIDQLPKLNEIV